MRDMGSLYFLNRLTFVFATLFRWIKLNQLYLQKQGSTFTKVQYIYLPSYSAIEIQSSEIIFNNDTVHKQPGLCSAPAVLLFGGF
jgi:hypothetical protein